MLAKPHPRPDLLLLLSLLLVILMYPVLDHGDVRRLILGALMFVPVLLFAIFMGAAYRFLLRMILHREISAAVVTVIFWMSLYAANKSWAKLLGLSLTLLVYLGGFTFLIDRYLASNADATDELQRSATAADRARTGV